MTRARPGPAARLAGWPLTVRPRTARPLVVRHGTADDVDALVGLHQRCSPETLERRFHAAAPRVSATAARQLLEPPRGWSLLAVQPARHLMHVMGAGDDEVVATVCAGELEPGVLEIGVLVRDDRQGEGIGSALVRRVAEEAAERGYRTMVAVTQPDNHGVPRMLGRAGLAFVPRVHAGLLELRIPLTDTDALPRPA